MLEDPPDRFHEGDVHCAVGLAEVDEAPHPVDGRFPLFGVAEDDAAALLVEFGDAELLDRLGAGEVVCLFDLVFDR